MKVRKALENRVHGWFPADFKAVQAKRNRRQHSFSWDKANTGFVIVLAVSIFSTVSQFSAGNSIYAVFIWLSCIVGFSLLLNILTTNNVQMNMKMLLAAWFGLLSVGGALVNVYLFSVPTGFLARVFSVIVFVMVHVPYIIALIAYFMGKKEFSGKVIGWFNPRS